MSQALWLRTMMQQEWSGGVANVPVPMAVMDDHCRVRVMNPASKQDVLLAQVSIGGTMMDAVNGAAELLPLAEARQRYFQQSLQTRRSLVFEDEVNLSPTFRWLCLPVMEEDGAHLVIVGAAQERPEASLTTETAASAELLRTLNDELRAPLASMVAMAATLSSDTTDDISRRAHLINQTGRKVLRRLTVLLRTSEGRGSSNSQ